MIIDGKAIAAKVRGEVAQAVKELRARGVHPGLTVVRVGEDPASAIYVRGKRKDCEEVGIRSEEHHLPAATGQAELMALIARLDADPKVHGILVQLPLPPQVDAQRVLDHVRPEKDVDGFHVINAGKLATGGDALVPCTPLGCLMLLKDHVKDLAGKRALVSMKSTTASASIE